MKYIFIDMDGVIADFYSPLGFKLPLSVFQPGFFIDKDPIKTNIKALEILNREGNRICILTAVPTTYYDVFCREKMIWANKYIPFIKNEDIYYVHFPNNDKVAWLIEWAAISKVSLENITLIEDDLITLGEAEKVGIKVIHPSHLTVIGEKTI